MINNPLANIDFTKDLTLSNNDVRELLAYVEEQMKNSPAQIEIPIEHHFSKGIYAREMRAPRGTLLMGKIHKYQNLNILSEGEVSVFSIDGVKRVKAPFTFVGSPGAKRLFYMHEDTVWTTIHGTNETDLEKIEDIFIAKTYADVYLASERSLANVLSSLGFTAEELKLISENESDQICFPDPAPAVMVQGSPIHGQGLFALKAYVHGDLIAPARIDGKRTPAGRFTNHDGKPNAKMILNSDSDVDLVAIDCIEAGTEILTDYYFTFLEMRS